MSLQHPPSAEEIDVQLRAIIRRSRHVIWVLLAAMCILLVVLLGAVGYLLNDSRSADSEIRAQQAVISAQQVAMCDISNRIRSDSRSLWYTFVAVATAGKPQSAAQQAAVAKLEAAVDRTYRASSCGPGR